MMSPYGFTPGINPGAMGGGMGGAPMPQQATGPGGLTEEQLQALREAIGFLGSAPEQQGLLEQQMAQAQALRGAPMQRHSSPIGAALGGLGHVINQGVGAYRQGQAMDKQQALIDGLRKHRSAFADPLIERLHG